MYKILILPLLLSLSYVTLAVLPVDKDGRPISTLAPMIERVSPGVVNIATRGVVQGNRPARVDPFFHFFFNVPNRPVQREFSSLGSGVIVDAERGLVLTNHHVIANATEVSVGLLDGRTLEGKVLGSDPGTDVAVIQIESEGLVSVPAAEADAARVGDFVIAIGNPFSLGHSVSHGIVSALYRSGLNILNYENFIQTDAPINPGNSGGALVNMRGELIGINTAIFSNSNQQAGSIGIGFAIPIRQALQVMEQILEHGEVKRGYLGVLIQDVSKDLADAFGLDSSEGALVTQVLEDSPAADAGLKEGDVVLSINGEKVSDSNSLRTRVGLMRPKQKVTMEVWRSDSKKKLLLTVRIGDQAASAGKFSGSRTGNPLLAGLFVEDPDGEDVAGVRVVEVESNSPMWRSGLRKGDVITSVNQQRVKNTDDFARLTKDARALLLLVVRGNGALFLFVR